ncbi:MAG: TMEM175 family protein [Chloroflexota bacterium]|nr:TMEM175 family protein [Chloroflexota bacterium]
MMPSDTPQERDPFAFARDDERGTTRLEGFSDGIFATAATLLIFSVSLPQTDGSAESLLRELADQWAIFAGLLLSYLLIASTWSNHHHLFRFIARTDHPLLVLNAIMLLSVVVIPFVTTLLASTLANPAQTQVGAALYGGVWTLGGVAYNVT